MPWGAHYRVRFLYQLVSAEPGRGDKFSAVQCLCTMKLRTCKFTPPTALMIDRMAGMQMSGQSSSMSGTWRPCNSHLRPNTENLVITHTSMISVINFLDYSDHVWLQSKCWSSCQNQKLKTVKGSTHISAGELQGFGSWLSVCKCKIEKPLWN